MTVSWVQQVAIRARKSRLAVGLSYLPLSQDSRFELLLQMSAGGILEEWFDRGVVGGVVLLKHACFHGIVVETRLLGIVVSFSTGGRSFDGAFHRVLVLERELFVLPVVCGLVLDCATVAVKGFDCIL